jgi:hypothetical protein
MLCVFNTLMLMPLQSQPIAELLTVELQALKEVEPAGRPSYEQPSRANSSVFSTCNQALQGGALLRRLATAAAQRRSCLALVERWLEHGGTQGVCTTDNKQADACYPSAVWCCCCAYDVVIGKTLYIPYSSVYAFS